MTKGNLKLAEEAQRALTAPGFETEAGYCQRWVRQVVQQVYGNRFDKYFKPSAYETMLAFKKSPYAVPVERGSLPGDLMYKGRKTSGKHGHVGIRIPGNKVAENSSSHVNPAAGDRDARGIRSVSAYGAFELIVRLPPPEES